MSKRPASLSEEEQLTAKRAMVAQEDAQVADYSRLVSHDKVVHNVVKGGSPSDNELQDLSRKIIDWKMLGRRLKFNETVLTAFHKDNKEWSEKAYAMLITWKDREGSAATYQVLYQALCHEYVNRRDLAEKICCFSAKRAMAALEEVQEQISAGSGLHELAGNENECKIEEKEKRKALSDQRKIILERDHAVESSDHHKKKPIYFRQKLEEHKQKFIAHRQNYDRLSSQLQVQQHEMRPSTSSGTVQSHGGHSGETLTWQGKQNMPQGPGEDPVDQDPNKTKIHEGTVTIVGTRWGLTAGAVHFTFPPGAVYLPTSIVVHKWNCNARSLPLQEHEAIVSNVIEISTISGQAFQFNRDVKLFLSHSAPDLRGYELVIKRQIDKKSNTWEDVDGTEDLRHPSDIEEDIPDVFFPFARADINECSTYAVVCRLKTSPSYTITSNGGTFNHPDYPGVAVTIPKEAVERKAEFSLELKVQEVPCEGFEGLDVFVGPVLRIICSHVVHFLKPVTIQLPVSLRDEHKRSPYPSTCTVRVLSFSGEHTEWVEITDDLLTPASVNGTLFSFQVEHFSGFLPLWCSEKISRITRYLSSLITNQPTMAAFIAYFEPLDRPCSEENSLNLELICCNAHDVENELQKLKGDHVKPVWENSKTEMIPGYDKAFVFVSGGISPVNMRDIEDFYLRCERSLPFKKLLLVNLSIQGQSRAHVEFRSTPESTGGNLNLLATLNLSLPTTNVDPTAGEELNRSQQHDKPSDQVLNKVARHIPTDWQNLGRELKVPDQIINRISVDHHLYPTVQAKAFQMLKAWKNCGESVTYTELCRALNELGLNELAKSLRTM